MTKGILATVAVIIVCVALFFGYAIASRDARSQVAQWRGESFVHKLYAEYAILGENCQGEDTDGDSYVSCDFRIADPSKTERIVHLQCPTIWKTLLGNTCKESRALITSQ